MSDCVIEVHKEGNEKEEKEKEKEKNACLSELLRCFINNEKKRREESGVELDTIDSESKKKTKDEIIVTQKEENNIEEEHKIEKKIDKGVVSLNKKHKVVLLSVIIIIT